MTVTVYLYDASGTELQTITPLSFSYSASLSGVDSKIVIETGDAINKEVAVAEAVLDGTTILKGVVDMISRTINDRGNVWSLQARTAYAKVDQNQVAPTELFNYSHDQLFADYAQPYGIVTNRLLTASAQYLQVTVGMTAWDVIDLFCRQVYGVHPEVTRDGELMISAYRDTTIRFGTDGYAYTSLRYIDDRSGILSKVYMQSPDNPDDFSVSMVNKRAADMGIVRERYYKTPTSWGTLPERGASEVLNTSNVKQHAYEITVPQYVDTQPADVVSIRGLDITENIYYVDQYTFTLDDKGPRTELVLWDMLSAL